MEMTFQPKAMEINGEFFAVYPASEIEEAKQAQKNGWDVLIEQQGEHGKVLLDDLEHFVSRSKVAIS